MVQPPKVGRHVGRGRQAHKTEWFVKRHEGVHAGEPERHTVLGLQSVDDLPREAAAAPLRLNGDGGKFARAIFVRFHLATGEETAVSVYRHQEAPPIEPQGIDADRANQMPDGGLVRGQGRAQAIASTVTAHCFRT